MISTREALKNLIDAIPVGLALVDRNGKPIAHAQLNDAKREAKLALEMLISETGNPPAFPSDHSSGVEPHAPQRGMSLRDYFAGQAIVGLMLTPGCLGVNIHTVAESGYAVADAMLKARKR